MVITAFRFLILIVILGLCLLFGIDFYVRSSTKDRIISPEDVSSVSDADCILVLGAGIRADGSPSPMLQDRLNTGIELYQNNAAPKLLMSGDHGRKKYNEVQTMKDIALDQGVPSEDVFMDHAGFSTYDSLYRARDVFQARKVIIVTQKYHLYRALYISRSLGLDAWGISADTRTEFAVDVNDAAVDGDGAAGTRDTLGAADGGVISR